MNFGDAVKCNRHHLHCHSETATIHGNWLLLSETQTESLSKSQIAEKWGSERRVGWAGEERVELIKRIRREQPCNSRIDVKVLVEFGEHETDYEEFEFVERIRDG